jgi:hypothetical protein
MRLDRGLSSSSDSELLEDVADMDLDRRGTEKQLRCDLPVRQSPRNESEHVLLPWCQGGSQGEWRRAIDLKRKPASNQLIA